MSNQKEPRRLQVVVNDEETGEEIALATGVETLVLLVAPDTLRKGRFRRILLGDPDLSVQLLFDILRDVVEKIGQDPVVDLTDGLDDEWLVEMTEGLPVH